MGLCLLALPLFAFAADAPLWHRPPVARAYAQSERAEPVLRPAENRPEGPRTLADAHRLAEQLRYEEAVVEYQRYLGNPDRPDAERALALFELAFIHRVLGDEVNAQARAREALRLMPGLELPAGAPAKQGAFLAEMMRTLAAEAHVTVLPQVVGDGLATVRVQLEDPQGRVARVLLRHALAPAGPFYASPMRCEKGRCVGEIPPPSGDQRFNAWYYVEALDGEGNGLAQAASPREPLQLSVLGRSGWYQSPWLWAGASAAVIVAASVVFLLAPPPIR